MRALTLVAALVSALLATQASAGPISIPVARPMPVPVARPAPMPSRAQLAQPRVSVTPSGVAVDAGAVVARELLLETARRRRPD